MKNRKIFSFPAILGAMVLFVVINLVSGQTLKRARLDLTEGSLHTLSKGTVNIIRNLEQPVTLRLFWSEKATRNLPGFKIFAVRVRELLEEYQSRSGGKIVLSIVNPEPFSEEEDDAVSLGLQGIPVEDGTSTLYFGLAGRNSQGNDIVMPFIQPEREAFLEVDISQMIYSLAHPRKVKVGLLSSLPIAGGPSPANPFQMVPPWMITDQLEKQFDVDILHEEEKIPPDIDVLMVVYPRDLSDKALYAVDQYVLKGGPALVFTDPLSEFTSRLAPTPEVPGEGTADRLLAAWGVKLENGKVVGDMEISQKVTFRGRFGIQSANYLPWITVRDDLINHDEVLTAQLKRLNLASAGSLLQTTDARTEFIPLLSTTTRSMLIPAQEVAFMPDPAKIMSEFVAAGVSFTLAARISGPALTAFPDGPPETLEKGDESERLLDSPGGINVVVIADTDMLQDGFWVDVQDFFGQKIAVPTADNADLAVNALDMLGGSPDLIGLRGRTAGFRPFTLLQRTAQEAQFKYRTKEQELINRLDETERKLTELQSQRENPDSPELTAEQLDELENFRQEKVRVRRELRDVQFRLNRDIERIEGWVRFINIGLVPLAVALTALLISIVHRRKDRKSVRGT